MTGSRVASWLATAKQMSRVTEQWSRCCTASSCLERPWDYSWGNVVKPTALSEVLGIPAR